MKQNFFKWLPLALGLLATGCGDFDDSDGSSPMGFESNFTGDNTLTPMSGKEAKGFEDNPFVSTADAPASTFSVDADGASYTIMRRLVSNDYVVNPANVRIEEYLNYFTFDYPTPTGTDAVAINAEVGPCPWTDGHLLVRLGMKGRTLKEQEVPRANFVFLVDVSGSMEGRDKLDLLKSGLKELLGQLRPTDRISLITYSGNVKKLLESTPVSEAGKIKKAIDQLKASGATAGGEALKMAYEEALSNYDPGCNNRVIMGTDGDFNVGVTSTSALVEMVESYASKGIYMTCLGFGSYNLNDDMMEQISNAGNGTYNYIDTEDEMMKVFVHERERFVSVANDSKCQVTFNPDVVSAYRLIGYENRVMNNEDFENDRKDAGEIGAGQTITALYELVPTEEYARLAANSNVTLATFDFRYKKTLSDASIPLQARLTVSQARQTAQRSESFYFAAGVAAYGMLLRQSPYMGTANRELAAELVGQGLAFDPYGRRAELLQLIKKAHLSNYSFSD